jgi:hypothetical protein
MELTYNSHLEDLIGSEGEKALSLQWLHDRAEQRYTHFNTVITLPVIVFSTLAGTASVGSQSLFQGNPYAPVAIGLVSILVGVLNTISSFFGWSKRAEGHRIAAITYSKIHRNISIELSLPRTQRVPAKVFLKSVREQIERLSETAPPIPPKVITAYKGTFQPLPKDVAVPEICNGLHKIDIYPTTTLDDLLSQTQSLLPKHETEEIATPSSEKQ